MEMNGVTVINRPVETVYNYVIDMKNDATWRNGSPESGLLEGESLAAGAIGFSRAGNTQVEWQVQTLVPGERVDWELLNGPFPGYGGYRFEEVQGGTRFTLVSEIEPSGAYKLLGPLFGWMGRRRNQADVEKLKEILESMPE